MGTPYDAASSPWPPLREGARYVEIAAERALERARGLELGLGEYQDEIVDGGIVRFFAWGEGVSAAAIELEAGLGDPFTDITATPQGAAAWGEIKGQLTAEGANALDELGAQTAFTSSFTQLTGQFGVDPTTALDAAKQFTLQAQTLAGSVYQVEGLIAAAQNPLTAPATLINAFTGTLVAIAVAAGASAGIGGAIVAAVAALVEILKSVGWIPSGPQGQTLPGCAGRIHIDPSAPGYVQPIIIGCVVGVYPSIDQEQVSSAANVGAWRRFPEPTNHADEGWFQASTSGQTRVGNLPWRGGKWSGDGDARLVDLAWPQYHHLECEQKNLLPGAAGLFQQAFFAAWKLNREMELNGQKAAEDWQVLSHVVQLWNRAYAAGSTYTFAPRGSDTDYMPASADCAAYGGFGPYESYLANDLAAKGGAGQPTSAVVNLTKRVGTPSLFHGTPGASSSSSSTAAPAVAVVATVGLGAAAWLALGKPLSLEALKFAVGRVFR